MTCFLVPAHAPRYNRFLFCFVNVIRGRTAQFSLCSTIHIHLHARARIKLVGGHDLCFPKIPPNARMHAQAPARGICLMHARGGGRRILAHPV